jgi:hypothetical protein
VSIDTHDVEGGSLQPMSNDTSAPMGPAPMQGLITIRYTYSAGRREFEWEYEPDPAIPDELAVLLLREVADRL